MKETRTRAGCGDPGEDTGPSTGSHPLRGVRRTGPWTRLAGSLASLGLAFWLAGCGQPPTAGGSGRGDGVPGPVDWTGVDLDLVEDTPYRIAFDPSRRVQGGVLDSVSVQAGADVIRSAEVADGELVIVPVPEAHGTFTLRAHVGAGGGAATSDRSGRVEPRTDVRALRLLRAADAGVEPAPGVVRVEALGDGRTLAEGAAGADGRVSDFQLSGDRRFLVLRSITVAGDDTSFVRRMELEVEPGADVSPDPILTEAAPAGWSRAEYRRYLCDAEDADGDRWHGVTMWEPAGLDCRIRRGDYDRVVLMAETPLLVDGRPAGRLDEAERAFVADQVADAGDGVAILGERLPVEVLEPDPPPSSWEVVQFGDAAYLRPTRTGTLLVYVDTSLRAGASLAWDTDGDGVRDTGFVMIGYQPSTDFAHADFTVSHELMRHAGLVGLASRDFIDRSVMSFYTPDAPLDPTAADLRAAEAMRRHPTGLPTGEVFGLVF